MTIVMRKGCDTFLGSIMLRQGYMFNLGSTLTCWAYFRLYVLSLIEGHILLWFYFAFGTFDIVVLELYYP